MILPLAGLALAVFAFFAIRRSMREQRAKERANLEAFRARPIETPGFGMLSPADVTGEVVTWSGPKNTQWGFLEFEVCERNRLLARYWLTGGYKLLEAETSEGLWRAEYEDWGGLQGAYPEPFRVCSVRTGLEEAQVFVPSDFGFPPKRIEFADGCAFTWKSLRNYSRHSALPFPWLHSRQVLLDDSNNLLLWSTGENQVTLAKEAASNQHLALLLVLVSQNVVLREEVSSD